MLDYDTTMRLGEQEYAEAITGTCRAGIPVRFTQTGGMNAALEEVLDDGCTCWSATRRMPCRGPSEQTGWGVGLYHSAEDPDPLAFGSINDTGTTALITLIRQVLRDAATAH